MAHVFEHDQQKILHDKRSKDYTYESFVKKEHDREIDKPCNQVTHRVVIRSQQMEDKLKLDVKGTI